MSKKRLAVLLEINAKFTRTDPILGFSIAMKATQFFVGIFKLLLFKCAYYLHKQHLRPGVKLVELAHTLFAEIDLKHIFVVRVDPEISPILTACTCCAIAEYILTIR